MKNNIVSNKEVEKIIDDTIDDVKNFLFDKNKLTAITEKALEGSRLNLKKRLSKVQIKEQTKIISVKKDEKNNSKIEKKIDKILSIISKNNNEDEDIKKDEEEIKDESSIDLSVFDEEPIEQKLEITDDGEKELSKEIENKKSEESKKEFSISLTLLLIIIGFFCLCIFGLFAFVYFK